MLSTWQFWAGFLVGIAVTIVMSIVIIDAVAEENEE